MLLRSKTSEKKVNIFIKKLKRVKKESYILFIMQLGEPFNQTNR